MPVKNILVVDDSPTERFFSVDFLTKAGYQVTTAENGEEGIAKAKLTRDEETRHIPVIVCTSKGQETDKIWGLRQGAADYVVKPVNPEELLKKIAELP